MALLNSYSSANRVIEVGKSVTYAKTLVFGSWEYASGTSIVTVNNVWQYVRNCTKTYKYTGMTQAAAYTCAAAMIALYTRSTAVSQWSASLEEFTDIFGGTQPMADIAVCHVDGSMYEVRIQVNEQDTRQRVSGSAQFAALFASENARDYDED